MRTASITRATKETDIAVSVALDGTVVEAFFYAFGPYEFARSMQALSGQIHVGDRLISEEALADAAQEKKNIKAKNTDLKYLGRTHSLHLESR